MTASTAALVLSSAAMATVYTDSTGDLAATFTGFNHLDIASMEVTNTDTQITFRFTVVGDVTATDWGKFMVGIDSRPGGDTSSNGWVRPISMPAGMDGWLGSWTDSGNGLENRQWNGSGWTLAGATYNGTPGMSITKTAGSPSDVALTVNFADLGLSVGQSFFFDAFTSGGGGSDSAVDSLANPNPSIQNWSDPYSYGPGSSNPELSYTIQAVPAPGALALVGLGGLVARRRRR
jgi:hypothetical protein